MDDLFIRSLDDLFIPSLDDLFIPLHYSGGYLLLNNKNGNKSVQSAGNGNGSSETTRLLSQNNFQPSNRVKYAKDTNDLFNRWLAGVIDGDGNFDIRQGGVLKAIRIKLHNRDVRILNRILNQLHFGRIKIVNGKPYSMYIVSNKADMQALIQRINGHIRIKVDSFNKACKFVEVDFLPSNYTVEPFDPYFAGLIDTGGSIVFNYPANTIECNLELKYNEYTSRLDFSKVIPGCAPYVQLRKKTNKTPGRVFQSIAFKYKTVGSMLFVYEYFMKNRLYSDFKFYRISKIKPFLDIRHFQKCDKSSPEFKIYSNLLLDWIKFHNPMWNRVPFVKNLV